MLLPMGRGDDGAHSTNEKLDVSNYIKVSDQKTLFGIVFLGTRWGLFECVWVVAKSANIYVTFPLFFQLRRYFFRALSFWLVTYMKLVRRKDD